MSLQFLLNSKNRRPDSLIYANIAHRNMHYVTIANEYTEGTSLQGSEPLEVQMYDGGGSFKTALEAWRHGTANGIIVGELIDSQDTWSERVILEGLLKYAISAGIQIIPLEEAYDICFRNETIGGNLIYNPEFRNTAKDFMPTAQTVPTNPDGYIGQCSVSNVDGVPTLITTGTVVYTHFGAPYGRLTFSLDVIGVGNIVVKAIKNNTDYSEQENAETIATIQVNNNTQNFVSVSESLLVKDNPMTAYEQLCAGYGDKIIGLRIEYPSGLQIRNVVLKQ